MPSSGREMINVSLHTATELFRAGEFAEIVRRLNVRDLTAHPIDPALCVLVAHAMALVGDWPQAEKLMANPVEDASASLRSRAYVVHGLVAHARGALTAATQHFSSALRLAHESKDIRQIAWASVYLLNHLVNVEPHEMVMAMLPEVRKAVIRAGDPHATAYLHQAIAMLEGQTGGLSEARRHCDLANAVLALSPNVWLSTNSALNRACIDMLTCRYATAAKNIELARKACVESGLARGVSVADSNLGHVQLQTGSFQRALKSFRRTLDSPFSSEFARLGALEGTARAHLALGQFVDCESTLKQFAPEVQTDAKIGLMYHVRWAAITKARLLMRVGNSGAAVDHLLETERTIHRVGDKPLEAAIHLALAQAFSAVGKHTDAAFRLLEAERTGITRQTDMQGQFYWIAGALMNLKDSELSNILRLRATDVWHSQGTAAGAMEIPQPTGSDTTFTNDHPSSNKIAIAIN